MERFRERDSTTDSKRTRGVHVPSNAKFDKIVNSFNKYRRKYLGRFHRKCPCWNSALISMNLLHLCPYRTTVFQEFLDKVGEARLNFTKWYTHAAHDTTKTTQEHFVLFSVDTRILIIIFISLQKTIHL